MNHHPHFPGTIPAFQELRKEDQWYFHEDFFKDESEIPLSDINRLIFLSHFNAIGKMWDELNDILRKREEKFKTKYSLSRIEVEDDYIQIDLVIDGQKKFILTDTTGELADTDLPKTEEEEENGDYPDIAYKIALKYGKIWDDLYRRMDSFCKCLGYYFEWDGEEFHLQGNGIRTSGYAWHGDNDSLFENLEAVQ
ncbi:MAG: hypothetical protein LUQ50_06815 [Methanospirillum sp.]|uniref:hypothetical protein n=1 Tax=Methanospirillum sp. TaxID=45200 RepID=UPI00236C0F81|nr:hypothetical protein [Methanospirillum sp.]MDD1728766.1 hypothetical protein [Methanospirillum sp.]